MSKGFTLAEVLVVTALFAILAVLGAEIFLQNNRFYETQGGEILSISATRESGNKIEEFTRMGIAFENSHAYAGTTYTLGPTAVVVKMPAVDAAGNVISGAFDYAIVAANPVAAAKLEFILDADAASARRDRLVLLSDKLSSLNFTYDNADPAAARQVEYEIAIQQTGRNPAGERLYGRVTLRNK